MSDIGGLQLLPNQKRSFSLSAFTGGSRLFVVSLLALILLGVGYGVLKIYTSRVVASIEGIDADMDTIYRGRDKAQEEKLSNFEEQIGTTKKLLATHLVLVERMHVLEDLVQPQVMFTSLAADVIKRTYLVHATTTSYSSVAKQIAAFYKSDTVKNVTLKNVQAGTSGRVEFTMELTLK